MSKQEEAGLILKLYELRREETMRKARPTGFFAISIPRRSPISAPRCSARKAATCGWW